MPAPGRTYPEMDRIERAVESQLQEPTQRQTNKRKRDSPGINGRTPRQVRTPDVEQRHPDPGIESPHPYYAQPNGSEEYGIQHEIARHVANANAASSTAAAALAPHMPQLTVPQPTDMSFPSTHSGPDDDRPGDPSFERGPGGGHPNNEGGSYGLGSYTSANGDHGRSPGGGPAGKPAVGTDEWHKVRKDNHKEVERRRRETINEGINELAKIVPGCDKNKGAILQRGVQYISQLKENETRNIEKWTLEKMLTEQAMQELTNSVDKLKEEIGRARSDADRWKARAEAAGVNIGAEETGSDTGRSR